ncbi:MULTISPECIES: efflux RND transporter periplasmic adaptor subunit [unclassified Thioalkalivibrio]|uniref:efflux RND transporter periplasmic adaptor subunit n=1 Tax=unclassified Thioalkalivibrio TaxID=2621013 RepID=UPI0003735B24|nr:MULTISPECIES: efflux RND transporter periplasmic adaptor subunit [unclassified Thioalkalivibrio]
MHHLRLAAPLSALSIPLLALLLALVLPGCAAESDDEDDAEPEAVEVPVREMESELVSISRTYTARTRSPREVEVRARVAGVLESRRYEEGEMVERGTELFRIDPSPYAVQVRSAQASLERAEAEKRQAEREWERVLDLYEDNAASGRERDEARSQLELGDAAVAEAEAALAEAQLDLDYTSVTAPLEGVAGLEERPEGSLLQAGDLLTTVTQLDPIRTDFAIPEGHLTAYGPQIRSGVGLTVVLTLPDGSLYPHQGQIDVTEAAVDEATGMVEVRALFPNREVQLLPGQFVRVTLSGLMAGHGMRVPHAAVIEGSDGAAVYVVDADDIPHVRPIQIGMDLDEDFLVTAGLSDGDRIVVRGVEGVEEGERIDPRDAPRETEEPVSPGVLPEVAPDLLDEVMDPETEADAVEDILDGLGNGAEPGLDDSDADEASD